MAIAPRGLLVKAPSCNEPNRFGLLSAITPIMVNDPHWMASGIEWEDFLCTDGNITFLDFCEPVSGIIKPADRNINFCHADPFLALGSYECSTAGRPTGEAFEIARQRLLTWEGRQVERTLWTGITENGILNPSFAFGNDTCGFAPIDINPAGALSPVAAVAAMEEALGDLVACGGVLHIPFGLAAFLIDHRLLVLDNGVYYTPTGFQVIIGHGYPGTGPGNAAAAAGETWMFATGPIVLARSNVIMVPDEVVAESVDRNINNITVRAERFYSVGWSCDLLAVRVALTCSCE